MPVATNIILPNGNTFAVGSEIQIQCDVQGYPTPTVTWYKNDEEIYPSQRVRISGTGKIKAPKNLTKFYLSIFL